MDAENSDSMETWVSTQDLGRPGRRTDPANNSPYHIYGLLVIIGFNRFSSSDGPVTVIYPSNYYLQDEFPLNNVYSDY